jgi:glyoxylase-like metal-dependent hydrolase (beta-lactamase superfamily II)
MLKRILVGTAITLLVLVLATAGLLAWTFGGNRAIQDGFQSGDVRIVQDGIVSLVVVSVGEGAVALIDAGSDPAGAAVLAELGRRGLGPDAVKAVLLTHGHADHAGGLGLFPGAKVLALPDVADVLAGTSGGRSPASLLMPLRPTGLAITDPLKDGDRFTVGTKTFQVFAIPGHSAGSAAYLVDDVLVLGDAANATEDGKVAGAPWLFSDDTGQDRESLRLLVDRLAGQKVGTLVFSHSGPLQTGLAPLADFARTP